MLWEILFVFTVVWLIHFKWKRGKFLALYNQIPSGLKWLPILGQTFVLIGNAEHQMKTLQMFSRTATKKGGVIGVWHTHRLYIVLTDPVAAECVLKTALDKNDLLKVTQIIIGNGSIFTSVPIWRPRRRANIRMFSPKQLINFVDIFSRQSNVLTEQLKSAVGKGPVSAWEYMNTYAMDTVCETTMGVKVEAQKNPNHPFIKSMEKLFKIAAKRLMLPWLHSDFVFTKLPIYTTVLKCKAHVYKFIDKIITEKRKSTNDSKVSDNDEDKQPETLRTFIDLMTESPNKEITRGYTDLELREEILVLLSAGSDTSAVGISFTIVMMSRHPEVQEKVYQELQEVFGDSDRPLDADDLPRLKYLEAVLRETLRLYPPVPIISRKVETDITLPSGLTIVEGCNIVISIWGLHRNPKYWGEDADMFRPERFIDIPVKHPAAFMPFSHGPRNCIGYQYAMLTMKTALAAILRKYKILMPTDVGTEDTSKEPLRVKFNFMMRHVDNYTVRFEYR